MLEHPVGSFADRLEGRTVVADTSALLASGTALTGHLRRCLLVVPAVVVKELEAKRGHPTLGAVSREWIRLLERLRTVHGQALSSGVPLEDGDGVRLAVEPNHSSQRCLPEHMRDGSNDATVLAVACNLRDEKGDVVLLSNDIPMRLHATLDLQVEAVDVNPTALAGSGPRDGVCRVVLDESQANSLFGRWPKDTKQVDAQLHTVAQAVLAALPDDRGCNVLVEVEAPDGTLAHMLAVGDTIKYLPRWHSARSVTARTPEQAAAISFLQADCEKIPLVSLSGPAGTGKTLMAVAVALDEVRAGKYGKVMVLRSLHELGQGQEVGFLPGDVADKMAPWSGAVFDAIDVIAGAPGSSPRQDVVKKLRSMVEVAPITFLRGRSLANTFIILEEAQNFSRKELLSILSRTGAGSKVAMTFDAAQVDNRFLRTGRDADVWSVVDDFRSSPLFAHVSLRKTERSRLAEAASRMLES